MAKLIGFKLAGKAYWRASDAGASDARTVRMNDGTYAGCGDTEHGPVLYGARGTSMPIGQAIEAGIVG